MAPVTPSKKPPATPRLPSTLIDGVQMIVRLNELAHNVRIRMVESVEIDPAWFATI
jgi:hypothetical protein